MRARKSDGDPSRTERFLAALEGLEIAEDLLCQALTHRSWEGEGSSNERLEFLGDAVLELLVSEHFFRGLPNATEGDLTRRRARTVSEPTLTAAAQNMDLGRALLMAHGEEATGGRTRPSMLSDAYEAVTAAVYLSGGLKAARAFIHRTLGPLMATIEERDFKSAFQEWAQEERKTTPAYRIVKEVGPDHNKEFRAQVLLDGEELGEGGGRTKKEAEQAAAKAAMQALSLMADGEGEDR